MQAPPETLAAVVDALRAAGCVFAEDEAALLVATANADADLDQMVRSRLGGRPLEYILGFAEFCDLRIRVADGVFVPRQRTQFLVRSAVALLRARPGSAPPVVLDLCCGCGAIGAAIAHRFDVDLHACDIEPGAVDCARGNIEPLGGSVYRGDLYDALPPGLHGRIDMLVVNAPYVPSDAIALMPPEARLYEARIALDGGDDGLDVQRRVMAAAPEWLSGGGHLLIETGEDQAARTAEIMRCAGFDAQIAHSDELWATVVIGRLAPRR